MPIDKHADYFGHNCGGYKIQNSNYIKVDTKLDHKNGQISVSDIKFHL